MPDKPIRRANYLPSDAGIDCVNDGRAIDADFLRDHEPLSRLHNLALHSPGVAEGLEVAGAIGQDGLSVMPGAAIDASGRWVVLPTKGTAGVAHEDEPTE